MKWVWWKIALCIGIPVSLLLIGLIITLAVLLPKDQPAVNVTKKEYIILSPGTKMQLASGTIVDPDILKDELPVHFSVEKMTP